MIPSKKQFLQQIINYPELKDNIIAYVFAKNSKIDISQKNTFFDNVRYYYEKYKEQKPEIEEIDNGYDLINEWIGKDLRIKNIKLKSIRGFPDSDTPFGIDLLKNNNEPQSIVILGGNATGKSSLYDALEYIFCDEIGEARLRNIKDYKSFLSHFTNGFNNSFCVVETNDQIFDIKNTPAIPETVRRRINPNTHFISDYDIYENGKLNYEENAPDSFHLLIAQSIGLVDLLEFHKNIKSFILYRRSKESRAIKDAKRNIEVQEKIIATTNNAIIKKQNILKTIESKQSDSIGKKNYNVLFDNLYNLRNQKFSLSILSSQINELIDIFYEKYNDYIIQEVKHYVAKEIQFLDFGLEILPEFDNCPFCLNSNLGKQEIEKNVQVRIDEIRKLRKSEQELKSISNDIIDKLNTFFLQLRTIKSYVSKEIKEIDNLVEFNELIQMDIDFDNYLSKISHNDIFYDLTNLTDNSSFLKNRNKFLNNFFSLNRRFISDLETIEIKFKDFIIERNSILSSIEEKIKEKTKIKRPFQKQIIEIKKEIRDFEKQIENAKNEIKKGELLKENNEQILKIFKEIKEEAKIYEKTLKNKLNNLVKTAFAPIKMVVEEVLEEFFKIDNRNFDITISIEPDEYDEETGEVLSEIITAKVKQKNKNIPAQSIGVILNTFHYRIFSTMVGIAIAIASRINTKINIPLVLDDIFYASDFENRATIETFLKALFEIFSKYTPDIPLQLIFFTHDQFIFESAMKVLSQKNVENVAFAKLYPPDKALEEESFKNILYKFPNYAADEIYNKIPYTI